MLAQQGDLKIIETFFKRSYKLLVADIRCAYHFVSFCVILSHFWVNLIKVKFNI